MKALSFHQPWASLIAEGVKTIETRSSATKYRGPLAIHASKRRPSMMHIPPMIHRGSREERDHHNHQTWLVIDTISDRAYQRPLRQSERVPKRATSPTLFYPHAGPHGRPYDSKKGPATEQGSAIYLPLGAIVATATLVDVVPIRNAADDDGASPQVVITAKRPPLFLSTAPFPELVYFGDPMEQGRDVSDQLPYGDFYPGRFAWLLGDVVKLPEPIPCRGHQGLWEWAER